MAEWIAGIISQSGMYGGMTIPQGNIGGLIINPAIVGDTVVVSSVLNDNDHPDSYSWDAKFGLNGTKLLNAFMAKLNEPWTYGTRFFEIEIEKPANAQYYKQTLVFYIDYASSEVSDPSYAKFEFFSVISKISRLEYATPTSTPTETIITTGSASSALIDSMGAEGLIPAAYDYHQGTWLVGVSPFTIYDEQTHETKKYWGAYFYAEYENVSWQRHYASYAVLGVEESVLGEYFAGFEPVETDDPNEDPDPGGDGGDDGPGGGGEQDKHQDPIPEPDLPPLSATAAGFVTMYKLYEADMQTFAKKLFDPDVWSAVKQLFADPMDFICGIMILPFSPHTSRTARPILQQVPPIAWDYYYPVIEQQYHIVDCGTITIPEYYKTALDYNPYTKDLLYLPYLGYRALDPDEVQGKTLKIKYHVDVMTGDCVAFIIRTTVSQLTPTEQVIAQFSGNCGVHVPFGRQSFDNAIAASVQLISGIGGVASGVAMLAGGPGGMVSGGEQLAAGMIAQGISGIGVGAVNGSKAHVERSGLMGASAGYMGVQFPYLIRQIPRQSLPDKGYYRQLNGYPCNEAGKLSDFSGYTAIESIELSGIGATQEEKTEILNMLVGGVIV